MNILFRVDSSSEIGTGHIMRDLVLAKQFRNDNILFATQNLQGNINYKIEESEFKIEILESNEFQELDQLIKKFKIDLIIIDHYGINHEFEEKLKKENQDLKIFVLDDTYEKHCCDILLNHNISSDEKRYKDLVPNHCELRCGIKYTLLREEFLREKKKLKRKKTESRTKTVFIAMGGSDLFGYNLKILKKLKKYRNIKVIVATTTSNKNLNDLRRYSFRNKWVTLYVNSNKIAFLINQSDLCIVTPSVTISEVVYLKKDFIAIKVIKNQDDMYKYLKRKRYSSIDNLAKIDNCLRKYINV